MAEEGDTNEAELNEAKLADKAKKKIVFLVRDGFPTWQWQRLWKRNQRHEMQEMITKREGPIAHDGSQTRDNTECVNDGVAVALMCGTLKSPACFKDQPEGKIPWACMWCQKLGTHEHLFLGSVKVPCTN